MMLSRIIFIFFLTIELSNAEGQIKSVVITNPLPISRDEVLSIPWADITVAYPALDTSGFRVINVHTKKEYTHQLEYLGTNQVQNLLIQLTIPAKASVTLRLIKGGLKSAVTKTYCRFVPERKDDFAWENDKIAFRMYGKALEKFPNEMAYGVDVWVKRTAGLVIDKRYAAGKYHIDNGDGLDYYHVGRTLGAGGIAPYINDTIWYSKNYREWKILDNGPLRSTFQLTYDEWNVPGKIVTAVKTISLDAGSQLNRTVVNFEWSAGGTLPVVIGIIKRKEQGEIMLNEKTGLFSYWEPQHDKDGTTGVACVLTTPVKRMLVTNEQLLAETNVMPGIPLVYYNGAAWDKAGAILNAEQWGQYLQAFQQRINSPLKVAIK